MTKIKFRTVKSMPGIDFTPTPIDGVPCFTLYAANEAYLPPDGEAVVVRCGIASKLPPGCYAEFAPLPVGPEFRTSERFAAHRMPVICDGANELTVWLHHLGGEQFLHIDLGDPVAVLMIHAMPAEFTARAESVEEITAA